MNLSIIQDYEQRLAFARQEAEKYKNLFDTYSMYRLGVFVLFILSVCMAISANEILLIAFSLPATLLCFGWIVRKQNGFDTMKNYYLDMEKVNANELNSIQTHTNIYDNGSWFTNEKHFYTSDLDIFGSNSLFQLINRCATLPGITKLGTWLHAPANKATILRRQAAIKEIGHKNDWKLDIQTHLLFALKQQKEQIQNLVSYLKLPIELDDAYWLNIYSQAAPFILIGLMIAGAYYRQAAYFIPVVALFNNRLVSSKKKIVDRTDLIAGRIGKTLGHFSLAFQSIESEEWESAYLKELALKIKTAGGQSVSERINQLSRLITKLNLRLNIVLQFVLNIFLLWDIRQVIAIENWKKTNHENLESAFEVLGEFEALLSLASLHVNNPEWAFPTIADGDGYTYKAKNLAHPLITQNRVANDFELNDTFKIDIITGSNMAGKSTFLRTVGINAVLGLCGAPVCADSLELSVIHIITYMRIKDSLNESTSTFKAELDRLQMLLAAVEEQDKVYFLIDEMLRGTNSVDKYLGSKAVIKQLIHKKGVGQVATHDLQIARLEDEYPDYVRNFYFDIQVVDGEMLFDYKIKQGECKTFNASLLLKQIGVDVREDNF
ncbi:MutS-related protein [Mucilaginibacter boryungensis]|uniref:DNA mismatch repair protein MutS n=1 Tax=Mucilaginibacter boryungensis TaxID=768480 RepID=A0ABR9XC36_9SPHI|nr:DNA mismatch repair protein MutS [Mucilaginibacter boryungensis]MBE9664932.1 DNA mismatch repair protein MutS [Mucilaginibacter boryungensis]